MLLLILFHFLLLWVSGLQFKAFLPLRILFLKWLTDVVMENRSPCTPGFEAQTYQF